jgi:hypothetical protein
MTEHSAIRRTLFVVGQVLFGGIMAFMGLNEFRSLDEQIEAVESKDVPNADLLVQVSHGMSAHMEVANVGLNAGIGLLFKVDCNQRG